ncbi:hypothetical protein ACFRAM_16020 [Paenibacillus sp. NPDC056722]|uniref:hypothetical protein n=1 Tax=Paenibacillus sp. NPDC056722 TaxID=3345924 RepID=UPI00367DB5EC
MKLVKRALAVCMIVVLASTLSILTTGVVVNAYIQSVLASFDIKLEKPAPGIVGMMRSLMGTKEKPAVAEVVNGDKGKSVQDKGSSNTDTPKASSSPSPSGGDKPAEEKVPEDALPVMGQAAGESTDSHNQGGSALDQQLVMTPEAMRDLKDNLPSAEKVNIFNILMNKLPQEEMQKISAAMEDGLTEAEVKELQAVIAKYVDPKEYDELMKMLTPTVPETSLH